MITTDEFVNDAMVGKHIQYVRMDDDTGSDLIGPFPFCPDSFSLSLSLSDLLHAALYSNTTINL